jgi:hypothetical protein
LNGYPQRSPLDDQSTRCSSPQNVEIWFGRRFLFDRRVVDVVGPSRLPLGRTPW